MMIRTGSTRGVSGVGSRGPNTGTILAVTDKRAVVSAALSRPLRLRLHSAGGEWVGVEHMPRRSIGNEWSSVLITAIRALHSLGPAHLLSEPHLPPSPLPTLSGVCFSRISAQLVAFHLWL